MKYLQSNNITEVWGEKKLKQRKMFSKDSNPYYFNHMKES